MLLDRRQMLLAATSFGGFAALSPGLAFAQKPSGVSEVAFVNDPVRRISDAEWKTKLGGGLAYTVLRHANTEYPGTGPFLNEHRVGVFHCKGCDLALFKSDWKYDSGTGWPSFFDKIDTGIASKTDPDGQRTEYHCARCLGHQGHVFNDGPKPTGLRYCNNGVALTFKPSVA